MSALVEWRHRRDQLFGAGHVPVRNDAEGMPGAWFTPSPADACHLSKPFNIYYQIGHELIAK